MDVYYTLFEDLLAGCRFHSSLHSSPFSDGYVVIGGTKLKLPDTDYSFPWKHVFSGQINYRKMNLLELRDLLYEMAMYTDETDKIKMLISRIEKDATTGNSDMTKYSNFLKKYYDLEIEYKNYMTSSNH